MTNAEKLFTFVNARVGELNGNPVPFWEIVRFAQELDPGVMLETESDFCEFRFMDKSDATFAYRDESF